MQFTRHVLLGDYPDEHRCPIIQLLHYTVFTADPPSPSNAPNVRIHARVEGFPNFRAIWVKVNKSVVVFNEIGESESYYD